MEQERVFTLYKRMELKVVNHIAHQHCMTRVQNLNCCSFRIFRQWPPLGHLRLYLTTSSHNDNTPLSFNPYQEPYPNPLLISSSAQASTCKNLFFFVLELEVSPTHAHSHLLFHAHAHHTRYHNTPKGLMPHLQPC